jgi:ribosome-associated protein
MLIINRQISIDESELKITAIRAQGPGGQNVNKVACAVHLRFDIPGSSLPGPIKNRLLAYKDYRISKDGAIVIKAQRYRNRERNIDDARNRLRDLIRSAIEVPKKRIGTMPSIAARQRRLDDKTKRSKIKRYRTKVDPHE